MREIGRPPPHLTGSLLVAHPGMLDPNFRRTVLFISAHDPAEGALGLVLNRPLSKQVGDLVDEHAPDTLASIPVFSGGPVARDQLMFASFQWHGKESLTLNHSLDAEEADKLVSQSPGSLRAFVGYSGWSAGQLEAEMKQKAWIVRPARRELLELDRLPKLWFDIMRELGPWYQMLAAAPDDPSLN